MEHRGRAVGLVIALVAALTVSASSRAAAQQPPPQQETMEEATTQESDMDDTRARGAFRLGRQYYEQGRFAEAAVEFERAFGLSGRGQLLFNAYLAFRDAQDSVGAARTLRGYLSHVEDVPDREHLEARLAALEQQLADSAATEEAHRAETEEARRQAEAARLDAEEARRTHYRLIPGEVWPWIVAGIGGAMVVGGAITGGLALSERSSFDSQCDSLGLCNASFDVASHRSTVETLALTTDVLLIGGGVIAATGVILGLLIGLDRTEEIPPVTATCTGDGCMAFARGEF